MRRGELYIAAARGVYTGKPRPVAIVQADSFAETASVTVCPLTTDATAAPLLRVPAPAATTGLSSDSSLMVDKLTTMRREDLRERVGQLDDATLLALTRALVVFLGIAT